MDQIKGSFQFEGAWTFTTSNRSQFINQKQISAKPDNVYHPSYKTLDKTMPVFSFNKDRRRSQFTKDKKRFLPNAVGKYQLDTNINKKLPIKIPNSKRYQNLNKTGTTLGPDVYKYNKDWSTATGKSFGIAFQNDYCNDNPPIGQYQVNQYPQVHSNQKQILFTTSERPRPQTVGPGVGDYQICQNKQKQIQAPKYSIGNSRRFTIKSTSPGPGDYSIACDIGKSHFPRKSQHVQPRKKQNNITQEQNILNIEKPLKNGIKFNKENRTIKLNPTYNPNNTTDNFYISHDYNPSTKGKSVGFQKSYRPKVQKDGPSPGQYNVQTKLNHSLGTMRKGKYPHKFDTMHNNLGPAHYIIKFDQNHQRQPRPTINQSHYNDQFKFIFRNAGPGSHDTNYIPKNKEEYSFGTGLKFKNQKKTPGPGDYEIGGTIGKIPKYHKIEEPYRSLRSSSLKKTQKRVQSISMSIVKQDQSLSFD